MKAVKRIDGRKKAAIQAQRRPEAPPTEGLTVSLPTTLDLRGIQVHFPFKPYKCQEDYMGKVLDALNRSENALLESPTGTGKTLCLLCSTLAWQREQSRLLQQSNGFSNNMEPLSAASQAKKKVVRRVPIIIYASRTHSQLSQVVNELRNTRYRPPHAVLGSREQMCVNPKVKKSTSTGSEINHDCNKLGKERKCRYKNKVEGFTAPPNESGASTGMQPVRDMEDLVTMGKENKVCPFYYTRSQIEQAELVFVPYNYLFDKDSRTTTLAEIPWDNSIIIFDEAHNLESFASESASFDLSTLDVARCIQETQRGIGYVENFPEHENKIKKDNIIRIKSIFIRLEEYILNLNNQAAAHRGEYMMDLFQKGASINHANHELFISEVRKLTDIFLDVQGGSNSKGAQALEHFVQCIKRVFGEETEARCLAKAQSYRVHITPKSNGSSNNNGSAGRTVSYWCFAPSEAMRELANLNVRSILVTSGTLSPLQSYAMELDLPFPNRLENPHIIKDDQIHVRVLGKGVSGKLLTSSYARRQDADYYTELGNTIVSLSRVIPAGMLIFFPSYGVMSACVERWGGPANSRPTGKGVSSFFAAKRKQSGSRYSFPYAPTTFSGNKEHSTPWKRLLGNKSIVLEPRSTSDLSDAITEFHKFLNMPNSKGVVLMGVCRGKISEGIDFANDMCRAVVITGIPFAPSFDPKVKMKREFLDHNKARQNIASIEDGGFGAQKSENSSLSGHEWYTQQAHRAVNQALGRVIRNRNDYGAILLLDSRFSMPGNQQGLSKWVRPHIRKDEGIGRAISSLVKFYKQAERNVQTRKQLQPAPIRAPNDVSIILRYEEEEGTGRGNDIPDEDEVTKVAIITRGDENKEATSGGQSENSPSIANEEDFSHYVPPDRIIARLDMKTFNPRQVSDLTRGGKQQRGHTSDAGPLLPPILSEPKKLAKKTEASKESSTVQVDFARSAADKAPEKNTKQSPAKAFFQQVQSRMSTAEFSSIKKSVVAMKQYQEMVHRKSFLKAACDIVNIVLKYESFENRSRNSKPEILSLLLQLIPKHYVLDCQRWTMYSAVKDSEFNEILESSLSQIDHKKTVSSFADLLRLVWFESDGNTKPSIVSFLGKLQDIVTPLVQGDNKFRPAHLGIFLKLLPLEYHGSTNALINEMKASMKIKRIKEVEKQAHGENVVKSELFRSVPATSSKIQSNQTEVPDVKVVNGTLRSKDMVSRPSVNAEPAKKRANPNPYQRKPSEKKMKQSLDKLHERKDNANPFKKAVFQSESDTFTGKPKGTSFLKSNAPQDLTCTVCDRRSEKPYLSPCGHLACWHCWCRWLERSSTCPTCRKPTKRDSLARAIFRSKDAR